MASIFRIATVLLLITVLNTDVVTAVPEREYNLLLAALRFRGYHLFANAISTTDLHYDIIYGDNFTIFAPMDSALYALDMTMSAADYNLALRFHVVPHRLLYFDLRRLRYGSNSFPTLVRGHEIHIVNPQPLLLPIMVEGVSIAYPGLYYDTHIAVHGLEGSIDVRSLTSSINSTSNLRGGAPTNSTDDHVHQTIVTNITQDHTPTNIHREAHAPSPQIAAPVAATSPQIAVPVAATSPPSEIITGINPAASPITVPHTSGVRSPDISPAHRIFVPVVPRHRQPETRSESIIQPREEHISIPTRSDFHKLHESITDQPREEHGSAGSVESISLTIHGVSLATKSTGNGEQFTQVNDGEPYNIQDVSMASKPTGSAAEEFTQVDDKIIDCPITDADGEQMNIANIRQGYLYTRELYTPINITCRDK